MESIEVEYKTTRVLLIETMTFDLEWPWTLLDLGQ